MTYAYDLGNGQRLLVQNDGDNTQVALSSGDSGQQQNQSTGFSTGEWSRPPELFRTAENLVLRLESKSGVKFIGVQGNQIEAKRARFEECGKTNAYAFSRTAPRKRGPFGAVELKPQGKVSVLGHSR